MREIERAKRLAVAEFKRLNDKLDQRGRTSTRRDGNVEAGLTVSRYSESLSELRAMLEQLQELEQLLPKDNENEQHL